MEITPIRRTIGPLPHTTSHGVLLCTCLTPGPGQKLPPPPSAGCCANGNAAWRREALHRDPKVTQPTWAQAFPGGVADAALQHALWRQPSGHLVALQLADGQLLWRSAQPLVPLLLGHGLAFGLALAPPRVVALTLAGVGAGAERWCSDALPWPEWAARFDAPSAAMDVQAGWLDDRAALRWHLRPVYAGGAAPGLARAKAAAAVGSCLLDVVGGTLLQAPAGLASATAEPPLQAPSEDPTVFARQVLGGVMYSLKRQPPAGAQRDTVQTTLIAHDLARGQELWRCTLDEAPRKAPRALRS